MPTVRSLLIGVTAGFASAVVGGAWQVVTRQSTTTTIAAQELVILRYTIPALLLLPVLLKTGLWPRSVPVRTLVMMVVGAGLPFGLLAMCGSRLAPAVHMGVLMAGASPLFAALLAWLYWHERPSGARATGLMLMAAGVLLLGSNTLSAASAAAWPGDVMFICAAALWAGFTLSFRSSGLSAWQGAALVNAWSLLLLIPWIATRGGTRLLDAPLQDVLFQAVWQGVIAGVFGLWTYAVAVTRLGAASAAAFAALVPVISAIGGAVWLADPLTALDMAAVTCAALGVALASGAWQRKKRAQLH